MAQGGGEEYAAKGTEVKSYLPGLSTDNAGATAATVGDTTFPMQSPIQQPEPLKGQILPPFARYDSVQAAPAVKKPKKTTARAHTLSKEGMLGQGSIIPFVLASQMHNRVQDYSYGWAGAVQGCPPPFHGKKHLGRILTSPHSPRLGLVPCPAALVTLLVSMPSRSIYKEIPITGI